MDSTSRFGNRVEAYVRHRPAYPNDLVTRIEERHRLRPGPIADVGAGTGLSSRLFLVRGYEVFAVEPNAPMRDAALASLGSDPRFHAIEGTAEATTLPAASVDAVVAAQAFHWFDPPRTRREMNRILRREAGLVILVWNERRSDDPFLAAYERVLFEHGIDYAAVRHQDAASADKVRAFFGDTAIDEIVLPNEQRFDREGLFGRALSSSYVPAPGHPKHEGMMRALGELWETHGGAGEVVFRYDTRAYVGRL
jgi:SAM-dependent methyltransferase